MNSVTYTPIGIVHSPFKEPKNVPIQAAASKTEGTVELFPQYADGLQDLAGFSYIILLCHLNLVTSHPLIVKPFLDDKLHGVFATRSPARPNPIGLSLVRLLKIDGLTLYVKGLDVVDGTPLLDIKPYIPKFDNRRATKIGWFSTKVDNVKTAKDDGRFCK
jgi:tRNA-Thr(GGU) m(6)t(6)A37 methyltransferase TsaA